LKLSHDAPRDDLGRHATLVSVTHSVAEAWDRQVEQSARRRSGSFTSHAIVVAARAHLQLRRLYPVVVVSKLGAAGEKDDEVLYFSTHRRWPWDTESYPALEALSSGFRSRAPTGEVVYDGPDPVEAAAAAAATLG
jgi:hypothetical protein